MKTGYFLIKRKGVKRLNLYLYSSDKSTLESFVEENMEIVNYKEENEKEYLELDGQWVRIS